MAAMAIQLGISQRLDRSLFNQFKTQAGIREHLDTLEGMKNHHMAQSQQNENYSDIELLISDLKILQWG
jgi:hypothetical protein